MKHQTIGTEQHKSHELTTIGNTLYFREIQIPILRSFLSVIVCSDYCKTGNFITNTWGELVGDTFIGDGTTRSLGCVMHDTEDKWRSKPHFILYLNSFDVSIIAHELIHVLFHLSSVTNIEINDQSQEWQACLTGWLMYEILKVENYEIKENTDEIE